MQPNPGGEDVYSRPRRPRPDTEARLLSGSPRASQQPPMAKSSTLSVNAPEFVPKSYQLASGSSQAEFTDPAVLLSVSAAEFVPSGGFVPRSGLLPPDACSPSQPQGVPAQSGDEFVDAFDQMHVGGAGDQSEYLLNEFENTMLILMTQPANIPEYLSPLCVKLQLAMTPELLHQMVDVLYKQCIYASNFRYTGARVCHYLCNHLRDHPVFKDFKQVFLQRCQRDFLNRSQLITGGQEGLEMLCGLALFMGELFLNVTIGQNGLEERLEFLPGVLTDLMLTLLTHPNDLSVKTTCQLLKMAGGPSEDSMKQNPQSAERFSNIFSALTALKDSPQLAPNMKALVESVLRIKQDNWGRSPSHTSNSQQVDQQVNFAQGLQADDPVFYNVQGKEISRDEAGYIPDGDLEDGHYVLTEEEEREYLAWQAETNPYNTQHPANRHPNHMGYEVPGSYQQWSTDDGYGDYQQQYGYDDYGGDDGYAPFLPDGLTMDEEAEKAYDDFLKSQHRSSTRK